MLPAPLREHLPTPLPLKIRLSAVLFGYGLVRIAGAASGVLVGLYVAGLANHRAHVGVALVGTLGAASYAAELLSALPLGMAADHVPRRVLVSGGALLGAVATQLFGMSGQVSIFFLSRSLEGMAAAAIAPALLAHLTDVTAGDRVLRARVMSYFELSLLGGLGVGGLLAGQLWERLQGGAFSVVAAVYLVAMICLALGAAGTRFRLVKPGQGWGAMLRDPSLRQFAPLMLCVSAIVGLWLGPTLPFLLTHASMAPQYMAGVYAHQPSAVGWLLLGYSLVFATGLVGWSYFLPRLSAHRAMRVSLLAMLAVCRRGYRGIDHGREWFHAGSARVAHGFSRPQHRSRRRHGRLFGAARARRCGRFAACRRIGTSIRGGRTDRCNVCDSRCRAVAASWLDTGPRGHWEVCTCRHRPMT